MVSKRVEARINKDGFPPSARKVMAIDLDGTLFPFQSKDGTMMGDKDPYPGAVEFVTAAKAAGWTIAIFTSRMSPSWWHAEGWDDEEGYQMQRAWCERQLGNAGIPYDSITSEKVPATYYIDDRALTFDPAVGWDLFRRKLIG